jgi:hypothetical protein
VERGRRVLFPEAIEHRTRENERAHLRQQDDKNAPHFTRRFAVAGQTVKERDQPAQRRSDDTVEPTLAIDFQAGEMWL